ncbi:lasso peptide biosynthesis B2 protein [Caulobacter sp. CCNWLY153]|uniref:Lasso peptide biosynthesis B2 protein n=1 Tax=Caulobacter radicis TaxID=2172650 RepID=A0A2T9JAZ6_9CAUL|nr:lasso peptide biosynthesis B2 protein [Caulobacter radicis]PVM79395.1 lasso peptide biosynthesis B2 protein [Caulobacter radicis]PVM83545.1 lasso peptide biosynthesis B2 protein [Caulobacter radicis]
MTYELAPGVSYCLVADLGVVLDLNRDRYLGLGQAQAVALSALARGAGVGPIDEAGLGPLIAAGLLVRDGRGQPVAPCARTLPARSAFEIAHERSGATAMDVVEVFWAVLVVFWLLRLRPFARVVGWRRWRRRRAGGMSGRSAQAEALARRFLAVRSLVPVTPICLLDSLAMAHFLSRRGIDVDVVLAVATPPFEAHAWAQSGDCALNESLHRTAMLTPILVV